MGDETAKVRRWKQLAVVVPPMLDREDRRYQYIDQNGKIEDPMELYRETRDLPLWEEKAKAEFTRAFIETPKVRPLMLICLSQ